MHFQCGRHFFQGHPYIWRTTVCQRKSAAQLTGVGLTHACPNYHNYTENYVWVDRHESEYTQLRQGAKKVTLYLFIFVLHILYTYIHSEDIHT